MNDTWMGVCMNGPTCEEAGEDGQMDAASAGICKDEQQENAQMSRRVSDNMIEDSVSPNQKEQNDSFNKEVKGKWPPNICTWMCTHFHV